MPGTQKGLLNSRRGDILRAQIAREEVQLAEIREQIEQTRARIGALRSELAVLTSGPRAGATLRITTTSRAPTTSAEKVTLFRRLFRGREDMFPTRFVSRKTGRPGYAPACANKFVRGVCALPQVKCSECPNQAFLAVDDPVVLGHLQGRHVMGVYPMLPDETCRLLAVDFDEDGWKEDVTALIETCRSISVPVAVERSRSGNGAHAWFFFTAPIPAVVARKMGCYLLTETMTRRHQLGMGSYDRLFPNQDTMPRGGFGNLIALPLQHEARQHGNTVFLDDQLEPFEDQWEYLASVERMTPTAVEAIAEEASRRGLVVGVRLAEPLEDEEIAPWTRLPSGRPRYPSIPGPLPTEVRAVLAGRLFVETGGLPSQLINQMKRIAAFQNPEFYRRQSLRLSTVMTPRVISCAEDFPRHIALPRGCRGDLEQLLGAHGGAVVVDDQRTEGDPVPFEFQGELTVLQKEAAQALLDHDTGVVVAPPGTGKTVLGTYLIAARARNTLVLVHRRPLLDQWVAQLSMFFGVAEKEVGQIGGGRRKPNGRLDVGMLQSLVRDGRVVDSVATYGQVIVDECHHVPAASFERVLAEVKARYIVGLTATPHRRDGLHPILDMQLGPVRFAVDRKGQTAHPFRHLLVVRGTKFRLRNAQTDLGIQEIYRALANDDMRNTLIIDDVIRAVEDGRSPILLTERRDHLEFFADRLQGVIKNLVVLRGGMTGRERREIVERLAGIPDEDERLVLATGRYIGEGFDDPRLDTLFLAMPISWKGTLVQYAGRLHRLNPNKEDVRIFDYVDRELPLLLRMFEKRLRTYRAMGYADAAVDPAEEERTDQQTLDYARAVAGGSGLPEEKRVSQPEPTEHERSGRGSSVPRGTGRLDR